MTNISCLENCTYCVNGKCSLNYISTSTNLLNLTNNCPYFVLKESINKAGVLQNKI
ncbi:hypothetical protein SAMN05428976_1048 [Clostridium sp. USBA 49]|jgi:hypothetical protein|uniref:hydroxymyristoyl-ACP dehydratase n=1 Tax=Clostridium TaxID=1485 RepID=UPI0009D4F25E|nr:MULTISPECIES: hydroxymyristoyl-ACP dehydratase [Clostridium]SKA79818.1 hypothetical protein SAMN05428976_1048 [Clostridium sp. USBA 49]